MKKNRIDESSRLVLAFGMNPTLPLAVVDDHYFREAFGVTISRNTLKKKILEYSSSLQQKLEASLSNSVHCIITDGAKDISKNKLIAVGLCDGHNVKLLDMVDTALCTLDEVYYTNFFKNLLKRLEDLNCFVPAIVVDNEAAQSSGIKKIVKKFPILHIKCGAHTLELLIDALSSHYKGLDAAIEMGRAMVVKINNAKCLLKQFIDIQRRIDPEKQPLSLVLPCNTRKWSSGYLLVSRLLRLQPKLNF